MTDAEEDFGKYLAATPFIDCDHAAVRAYALALTRPGASPVDNAIRLYYAVRDDVRYDPYDVRLDVDHLKASYTLQVRRGFCVSKAVLLAAAGRAIGIPSRLGFADVRNHLTTPRLRARMGTDLFTYHGYTELFLAGRWVKATPAFNSTLCERFNVQPLEFDGVHDSLFQAYNRDGDRHMEYIQDHGTCADVPLEEIVAAFGQHYFRSAAEKPLVDGGDFEAEARPL